LQKVQIAVLAIKLGTVGNDIFPALGITQYIKVSHSITRYHTVNHKALNRTTRYHTTRAETI